MRALSSLPGFDIQADASLSAAVGRMETAVSNFTGSLERESRWRQKVSQAITQVPFMGTVAPAGGSAVYDQPDQLQAKTGYIWGVRRLTVQGFTAGSVTVFRNSASGEPVMPFPIPAVNTIGRGELLLMPGDRLVFSATGITGVGNFWGVADCIESWYLPFYLD